MIKFYFSFIIFAFSVLTILSCSKKESEEEISLADVPKHILAVAQDTLPGIEITEAEIERTGDEMSYELEGILDSIEYEIEISSDGAIIEVEMEEDDNEDHDSDEEEHEESAHQKMDDE